MGETEDDNERGKMQGEIRMTTGKKSQAIGRKRKREGKLITNTKSGWTGGYQHGRKKAKAVNDRESRMNNEDCRYNKRHFFK